ncbi:pleckstrin homology domain-containing family J member 1-like [Oppia nitens]|uniref:pleckstrin homology domain-containing family J member 1-like n=1 Tax=Oppia nitens TaxID=1686743 RepID=UPI0023DA81C7|nr:pleckstrin homology domain-containing family J member 1-like [Oppia nitens]
MRFNERELVVYSSGSAVKEGRIYHKNANSGFREGYKERWFKLKGNLLFYYRVNEFGGVYNKEPIGVLIIEMCRVQREDDLALPFAFSLTFDSDLDKKHLLGCANQRQCDEWVQVLSQCSYQNQRNRLLELKKEIMDITGTDPLASYSYQNNDQNVSNDSHLIQL